MRLVGAVDAGDAEVAQFHAAFIGQEDVGRLDIPVDDAIRVGHFQRTQQLAHDAQDFPGVEVVAGVEIGLQLLAMHVLHDDIGKVLFLAVVIDGDDVGMIELAGGLGLDQEAAGMLLGLARIKLIRADGLDGDGALDDGVEALIDDTHRALADRADDLVFAQLLRRRGHDSRGVG